VTFPRDMVRQKLLMWFGLLAAPAAWVIQFLLGFGVTQAKCNPAGTRWGVAIDTVTVAATVAAALVALLGCAAAFAVFRATRDAGSAPPPGRIHFLSVLGLTTSPLFFLIILWSGVGVLSLKECVQS
jgi:hypothetical protein